MNIQELSQLLKKTREEEGISKYRVAKSSGLRELQVSRIESTSHSYVLENIFKYLGAIDYLLYIENANTKNRIRLSNVESFYSFFNAYREENSLSQVAISEQSGISLPLVKKIGSNRDSGIKVDNFLKCIHNLGYEVQLIKNEGSNIEKITDVGNLQLQIKNVNMNSGMDFFDNIIETSKIVYPFYIIDKKTKSRILVRGVKKLKAVFKVIKKEKGLSLNDVSKILESPNEAFSKCMECLGYEIQIIEK